MIPSVPILRIVLPVESAVYTFPRLSTAMPLVVTSDDVAGTPSIRVVAATGDPRQNSVTRHAQDPVLIADIKVARCVHREVARRLQLRQGGRPAFALRSGLTVPATV